MSYLSHAPVRAFPLQSSYAGGGGDLHATIAANRAKAGIIDDEDAYSSHPQQVYSHRPVSASSKRFPVEVADADETARSSDYYETTRSGRVVPALGLHNVSSGPTVRGITRVPPVPVGPTVVPSVEYRSPSGTSLNKIPHSARQRLDLLQQQHDTKERLRAKALDRKLRDAIIQQEMTERAKQTLRRPRSASAKKSAKASARAAQQQSRGDNAYLTQDDIASFSRPYEPVMRPSASGPLLAANGRPISQPGSARKALAQPLQQWGRAGQPADRANQLISSSSQSRLSAAELASQPVAGVPSNSGLGNDLATILGGGHENVVFGSRNATAAETRQQTGAREAPQAWATDARDYNNYTYAPFATTIDNPAALAAPARFNDQSGAVMVRDELSREPRHASASLGYGRGHAGYREYVSRPAAASGLARGDQEDEGSTRDPFSSVVSSILTWNTDGPSSNEQHKRDQWTRSSGDYGAPARPPAGLTSKEPHEPLRLYHDDAAASTMKPRTHRCGPVCGKSSCPSRAKESGSSAGSGSGSGSNPLNPYTADELSTLTARPVNLAASSIGFGKKHAHYKMWVLGAKP